MNYRIAATALAAGLGLFAGASLASAQDAGSFHRSYTVNGPVTLEVETGAGSIHVTGTPGSVVTVDGTIHQSFDWLGGADPATVRRIEDDPPIAQAGNNIDIHSLRSGWNNHIWISYVVTTPPNAQLEARTGSGTIQVSGLNGNADATTGSGDIRLARLGGSLHARTGSGDISFDQIGGAARCSTGSGSIAGDEVAGRFTASTASGDVRVQRLDQGGEVHTASGDQELGEVHGDLIAHAASGGIRAGGSLDGSHHWDLSAASGSITLLLGPRTNANLELETGSGRMTVDQPVRSQGELGRHAWNGVMGDGNPSAELTVHTASGSIHIH